MEEYWKAVICPFVVAIAVSTEADDAATFVREVFIAVRAPSILADEMASQFDELIAVASAPSTLVDDPTRLLEACVSADM